MQRTGEPGADGANFWIRGAATFSGTTDPLIFIDGVEVSAGDMNAIPSEAIENFSILKDASATALYGARGANGVILITTRTGKDLEKHASMYASIIHLPHRHVHSNWQMQ